MINRSKVSSPDRVLSNKRSDSKSVPFTKRGVVSHNCASRNVEDV